MKEKESIRENLSILQRQCRFCRQTSDRNRKFRILQKCVTGACRLYQNKRDTACLLFVENEADKRGKMYKAVKSKGRVVEMARQDEKTLLYWVAGNVKKEGYKIKEQTARYLLSTTGTDMENLEKELEKLFCYCMGKEED